MAVEDLITILIEYYEDGEDAFRDRRGPEAVIAVRDLIDLLRRELGGQLDYDTLWADFEAAPRETAPDLEGALEALVEADPGLAEHLEALLQEYYATAGPAGPAVGEQLPEAETSEFRPREEPPVEEPEPGPTRHTDDAGEGTYLYGNVPSGGDVSVEDTLELQPDVLDVRREREMLSFDVQQLFERLQITVRDDPDLDDQTRRQLTAGLEDLQVELMLGDDADEDRVVSHLRAIGRLDIDVLDLVLSGLRHTRSQARGLIERAIERIAGPEAGPTE